MKKALLLLPMLLLALTGCKKEYFIERPNVVEVPKLIKYFEVRSNHWLYADDEDGLNGHFFFSFNFPGMSQQIFDNGIISVEREIDGIRYPIQSAVRFFEEWDYVYDEQIAYAREISYDYSNNAITFYVTNSDFFYERPETMLFRFAAIY